MSLATNTKSWGWKRSMKAVNNGERFIELFLCALSAEKRNVIAR
jgi:hypothetical protein